MGIQLFGLPTVFVRQN